MFNLFFKRIPAGNKRWESRVAEMLAHEEAGTLKGDLMADSISPSEISPHTKGDLLPWESMASTGLSLTGNSAHRRISSNLRGHPAAQQLSEEVYDFYGNCLSYTESSDFTSTLYVIQLQHGPIALKSADIQLQLGTGRTVEALTHELLHLYLPMLGFPLGELVTVPLHFDHDAQLLLGRCNWVVNLVQHEINFQRFVALGFNKKYFLAKRVTPRDYGKLLKSNSENRHIGGSDFSRWCIEYFGHLFNARHGGSKDHLQCAQDTLHRGSSLHPELKQTVAEIDRWFEAGVFKDPDQYPRQVNLLLEFMRIPKFTGWVILKRCGAGKTIAVRLDSQRIFSASCKDCNDRSFTAETEC
jgi:hypothetical protein